VKVEEEWGREAIRSDQVHSWNIFPQIFTNPAPLSSSSTVRACVEERVGIN